MQRDYWRGEQYHTRVCRRRCRRTSGSCGSATSKSGRPGRSDRELDERADQQEEGEVDVRSPAYGDAVANDTVRGVDGGEERGADGRDADGGGELLGGVERAGGEAGSLRSDDEGGANWCV